MPLTDPDLLRSLHRDVLAPSFPPAELVDEQELLDAHASGRLRSLGVVEEGRVVAGVVGEWFADARVLLVLYLAIAPDAAAAGRWPPRHRRARGLAHARPARRRGRGRAPAHHAGSEAYGDPVARLRFYARLGARVLALPYFQPGDGPGGERVPALLLVSFPLGPHTAGDDVPAAPLRAFLAENLRESEGTLADDAAARRLLDAAGGDSVRLVDPDDPAALATVPVGTLAPAETRAPTT